MAAKKKTAKTSAKKAAKKKAAKKKAAKKKAVKKKAAKKKVAKKKATKKKAAKKKATKKKAAKKKAAARRKKVEPEEADEAPELEAEPEVAAETPALVEAAVGAEAEASEDVPAPRRRARVIPPLPDEDEEYVPFEEADAPEAPRDAPTDASPQELLEGVRAGDLHVSALEGLSERQVRTLARKNGVRTRRNDSRESIIERLVSAKERTSSAEEDSTPALPRERVYTEGLLEMHPDGYGFLRKAERSYQQHPTDIYVSAGLIRKYQLKPGHWITGYAERPNPKQPQLALKTVDQVNHEDPARLEGIVAFESLTVVYPDQRFILETGQQDLETRVIDLFCPLGMGQRGLIVAPPRTGKTVLLTKLADAIAINNPSVDIVVLLVDERPEEVTNMRRSVKGEVVASTFDKPASNHVRVAELVVEKVKRMVEFGRDVVLLLDSITRMGRAYNNQTGGSGRLLSGGLDANALTKPKRFFGSARNVEDGGSLTIVATALIDTGSKMDEVIFEEFKGTGNMEIVLDRDMANNRVWPAIDLPASGTRNEDLLLHPDELRRTTMLRRGITGQDPITVMTALRKQLLKFGTNGEFLLSLGG
ncbi:MAG: transcription termination factor Rho [Planctomycetota bacterium]|nr:transcription termination factor Rho [Planctomycetota bacterium]